MRLDEVGLKILPQLEVSHGTNNSYTLVYFHLDQKLFPSSVRIDIHFNC